MSAPPIKGPATAPIAMVDMRRPMRTVVEKGSLACSFTCGGDMRDLPGLFSNGAAAEMIVSAPEVRPEEPMPATALPTMSAVELGAAAQTTDPNSKIPRNEKKVYFDE